MKAKQRKVGLNLAQREAIEEARKGRSLRLRGMIMSYENKMERFKINHPDPDYRKWAIGMRAHYSKVIELLWSNLAIAKSLSVKRHGK